MDSIKKPDPKLEQQDDRFSNALSKIAKADAASSRAAIEAAKATKPSRHTRFVYDPAKGRA
jgi:hypothetical protein